jgi:hypothetical protein
MNNYASLNVLQGNTDSMGLPEIEFRDPLTSENEKTLFKRAVDTINQYKFLLNIYWSLVEPSEHEAFVQACTDVSGCQPGLEFVPITIQHGKIYFDVNIRFEGYRTEDKETLVQKFVDTGIHPSINALEFTYRYTAEREKEWGIIDHERLALEQRRAFAQHLSFHSEE